MRYAVLNCDNTVRCDTLEAACHIAETWFPDNWNLIIDLTYRELARVNAQIRAAYGQGDCPDSACPVIEKVEAAHAR